jgi:hypothetical protein
MEDNKRLTRTTTLMMIMCLLSFSLTINSVAGCDCCISFAAKACCVACGVLSPINICKETCCYPCTLVDSVVDKTEEMGVAGAKMEGHN